MEINSGGVLLSLGSTGFQPVRHHRPEACATIVSSALQGLTSEFGMGSVRCHFNKKTIVGSTTLHKLTPTPWDEDSPCACAYVANFTNSGLVSIQVGLIGFPKGLTL